MEAPTYIGASLVDAPPGKPGGTEEPTDDRAILAAVRDGDMDAFGALYSRHVASVRRLARRVARDRYEADDIVSEVFANTLRAIRHGRGPKDDAQAYLLRSVRHTAGKLRSRKDTGRSEPVPIDRLDRPVSADVDLGSDIEIALSHLPDRHRDVLWATCVEGRPAREVAAADGLDANCVTSLTLRARRALGRSYLLQRTARPEATGECRRIRASMPGCLRDEVSAATVATVHDHIATCTSCCEVYDEMGHLDRSMCSVTIIGLLVAAARGWLRLGAPIAATVAKPLASALVAGAMVTGALTIEPPVRDLDTTEEGESGGNGASTTARAWPLVGPMASSPTANDRADRAPGLPDDRTDDTTDDTTHGITTVDDPTPADVVGPQDLTTRPGTVPSSDGAVPPPLTPEVAPTDPAIVTDADTGVSDPNAPELIDPQLIDPELIDAVDDVLTGTVETTQQLLTGVTDTVNETVTQVGDTANTIVTDTVSAVGETVDEVVDDVAETVDTVADTVDDVTTQVIGSTEPAGELVDDVVTVVQDDVLDDVLAPLTLPTAPQDNAGAGDDETVTELTDDTVGSLFGVVGGGLGLFGN